MPWLRYTISPSAATGMLMGTALMLLWLVGASQLVLAIWLIASVAATELVRRLGGRESGSDPSR